MIVKVQRPLAGEPQILIYNEDGTFVVTFSCDEVTKKLFPNNELKIYWEAEIERHTLNFLYQVADEDW
jgi:hypothetical protein